MVMARPQRRVKLPSVREAKAAAIKITDRRVTADDPDLERMPNPIEWTPDLFFLLIIYVRTCNDVPDEVLRADVHDALTLTRYLNGVLEKEVLGLITLGKRASMTWS